MSRKRRFVSDLNRAFSSLAYADLGEHLPQAEKEAVLGIEGATPVAELPASAPTLWRRRRVALAVQGRVQSGSLHYARNACERLDADLDILTDLTERMLRDEIETDRKRLARAGLRVEVTRLGRNIMRGVVHYARARSGLLFVVVSAEDTLAERVTGGVTDSRNLGVPWVVVTSADPA